MATSSAHCIIECSDQPLDLSFHPTRPYIVAAGLVDGTAEVHDFQDLLQEQSNATTTKTPAAAANDDESDQEDEVDTIVSSTTVHAQILPCKKSESGFRQAVCRAVQFSLDGGTLYTGGSGGDLVGLDASAVTNFDASHSWKKALKWRCMDASHGKAGVQVIHEFQQQQQHLASGAIHAAEGENGSNPLQTLLATGDEAGGVRLWDARLLSSHRDQSNKTNASSLKRPPGCIHAWKVHEDYISGFANSEDGHTLVASSADCTISVYDLRMAGQQNQPVEKVVRRSDDQEDELLSVQLMKHGRKLICGSGEGVLSIFSWGTFGDCSDRFPGHPASVDALLPIDEDTLLTGSSDGLIRVVQIHPNKLLGILGDHEGFPIEKLKMNSNRDFVGSVTHDQNIRIWDARILKDDYDHEMDHDESSQNVDAEALLGKTEQAENSDGEWEDMDEEMGDNDENNESDSDSDDERKPQKTKNEKRKSRLKTEQEEFFKDL